MTFKWVTALGKPIGFLLLLSTQVGVGQEIAQAEAVLPVASSTQALQKPPRLEEPKSLKPVCPAELGGAIAAITSRPQLQRSDWGILIQTSATPQTLYALNSKRYFIPASTAKLLTTAAALQQLGPQFRYRTSVYQAKSNPMTTLRVLGRGDPSLSDIQLASLAQQLSRQNIRQVDRLIADDSYFQGPAVNPSWEWEDVQADYGAPVNSLILNQNAVELQLFPQALGQPLRVAWTDPAEGIQWEIENSSITAKPQEPESVSVSRRDLGRPVLQIAGQMPAGSLPESVTLAVLDPVQQFLRHFHQALRENQIRVARTLVALDSSQNEQEVAVVESPPLSQLLVETNQQSNNLYAESLLRTLGATQADSTKGASAAVGLEVVKQTLTGLGVAPQGYVLADGSGLSRHNLISPETLVQTLKAMRQTPQAALYRASLPVAGVSGTLKNRFRDTPAQGILQAKTGSMSGVSALSGYLNGPNFAPLVFSIVVNQSDQSGAVLRQAIDEMILLLARLRSC